MRNAHTPEGPKAHASAQDYRRWSNEEMINRLGLPPIVLQTAADWERQNQERIEHNACVMIRRAIFRYMEEYYGSTY